MAFRAELAHYSVCGSMDRCDGGDGRALPSAWGTAMAGADGYRNRLLAKLSATDAGVRKADLELVALHSGMVLEAPDTPLEHVYFPEDGVISMITRAAGVKNVEIGVVGREGLAGVPAVLGDDRSVNEALVQIEGAAWRVPCDALRRVVDSDPVARGVLLCYVQSFFIQTAHTALTNARARVEQRLARWLLMVHDRVDTMRLELTHEFLATMLGVRRPGVTVALHLLEGRGAIRSRRGEVVVVDRASLEEVAGVFYGMPEAHYRRILGCE